MTKRGKDLPWAKLSEDDIRLIRACVEERERLRKQAAELSNAKLAEKFGVHTARLRRRSVVLPGGMCD